MYYGCEPFQFSITYLGNKQNQTQIKGVHTTYMIWHMINSKRSII